MIVKNEAHCIEKGLRSVLPYLSYWIICDTGSTDETETVVKQILADIPGEFHHHEWQDFATNRNLALQLAQKHADYILILDADDYLQIHNPQIFSQLSAPAYQILIQHHRIQYHRIQLFKSNLTAYYEGVVHECLMIPLPLNEIPILKDCVMIYGGVGNRSSDPQKYYRDAQILERALIQQPDHSRYAFYLAQSYRDAGESLKALIHYQRRAIMIHGWHEETFVALLEAGKLLQELEPQNIEGIETLFLRASHFSRRAEPFYYLAYFHRLRQNFHKAYFYAEYGLTITTPPPDALFLEHSCYRWRLLDEYSVAAYWAGYHQQFREAILKLLTIPDIPEADKQRIMDNQQFF
jgi:glycosyltransferase involved in cell wall biosynthesis